MNAKYALLECLSLDEMLSNMALLKGCKVIVDLDRFGGNIYNMRVYGEMPQSWDWVEEDDGLWEGDESYEEMKSTWGNTYGAK